MVTKRLDMGN